MSASLLDSPLHARLFPSGEAARLFSDSAVIRAMLLVEAALAKAQAARGIIPDISAAAIQRASLEVQIDPASLAVGVGENAVVVPALVAAFRAEMNAPEHAQYLHWGATSQDIMDTALMLRLRQVLSLAEDDLRAILLALCPQARAHADTPMMARTYNQHAVPTTWGAVIASWGAPLCDALDALEDVRARSLWVSLSGAAGTSAALGAEAAELRADIATALGLHDPGRSWHTDRTPVLRITDWITGLCAPLGALGETLLALAGSDIAEVSFSASGQSSTMPQKQNPVQASALVAMTRHTCAMRQALTAGTTQAHQRDGAAWLTEWLALPETVLSGLSALRLARALSETMQPQPDRMAARLMTGAGLHHAEALSFALTRKMRRPEAQAATKALVQAALEQNIPLPDLARREHPDLPDTLFDLAHSLGDAPAEARRFAARVESLGP